MIILNKNKHFNKLTEELFNMSMSDIRELNVILTPCGAKPYIEKDKEGFVTVTFLYLLFLQELNLQKKYYPKYKEEVSVVLDVMITQIAERFHYIPAKLKDIYMDIRSMLDKLSNDSKIAKVGLYYGLAVHYFHFVFSDEYSVDDSPYEDDTPYVMVGRFFQNVFDTYAELLS
jgi:hypothetical protein